MGCYSSKPEPTASGIRGVERQSEPPPVPRVKLVLLGNSGVGKSCLVLRYVRGQFDPSSKVTVGAAFMAHAVHLPDGHVVKFEIWDTAGQERYSSLAPLYYRGAAAAAVVYDITDQESFGKAKHWVRELQKNASSDIVIILVGNKTDLEEERKVDAEEAKAYADSNGMLFMESSAKTAANVAQIFQTVAQTLVGREASPSTASPSQPQSSPAKLPTSTPISSSSQGTVTPAPSPSPAVPAAAAKSAGKPAGPGPADRASPPGPDT